jgi:hypothetical protein
MLKLGRVFRRMGLPAWTFLGIGVASIWFNTISGLLEDLIGTWMHINSTTTAPLKWVPALIVIGMPFLLVLAVSAWQAAHYKLSSLRFDGGDLRQPACKRILILLVSNVDSAMFAVRYHFENKAGLPDMGKLERVYLIYSNEQQKDQFGESTRAIADKIKQEIETLAASEGRQLSVQMHDHGVSPADAQDTFDYVNRVYRGSGCDPGEIIADFTGGTKPMTTGMIMACLKAERELEYVSYNRIENRSCGPFVIDYQHTAFDLIG